MKKYLFMLFFLLFQFCVKNEKDTHIKGIEVISQVFSDKINNEVIYLKDCELSKKNFILPNILYTKSNENTLIKTNSQLTYLSDILDEKDTLYIKNQINFNIKTNLNELKKYNYKLSDDNIKNDSIKCKVSISLPIFNKSFNKFYIIIEEGSSFGEYLFIKNQNNKWLLKERISLTME